MAFVYILQSLKTGKYYIGSTDHFEQRMNQHKKGRVVSTKALNPFKVVLKQEYFALNEAKKIECKLKRFKRKDYIDKIVKDGYIRVRSSTG